MAIAAIFALCGGESYKKHKTAEEEKKLTEKLEEKIDKEVFNEWTIEGCAMEYIRIPDDSNGAYNVIVDYDIDTIANKKIRKTIVEYALYPETTVRERTTIVNGKIDRQQSYYDCGKFHYARRFLEMNLSQNSN